VGQANLFFHLPARLEGDHGLCGHYYLFACAGVACWASLALLDLEHPEVPKLNAAFLYQRVDYSVEDPLDDLLDLQLGKAHVIGDRLSHVFLGHGMFLSGHQRRPGPSCLGAISFRPHRYLRFANAESCSVIRFRRWVCPPP
jgi:hypothetical protein